MNKVMSILKFRTCITEICIVDLQGFNGILRESDNDMENDLFLHSTGDMKLSNIHHPSRKIMTGDNSIIV